MAIAEDQRRRKALEDRRREQKEATERFRSAISRLRTTTKAQNPSLKRVAEMHVECKYSTSYTAAEDSSLCRPLDYLPRKAKPPTSRTGSHSSSSAGRDSRTHEGRRERVTATRERIALGPEVEVSKRRGGGGEANTGGLQRRTPSLEDVLRSVRGSLSCCTCFIDY